MRNKQDFATKPADIQMAGFAFTITGGILAVLGAFIVIVELFNDADAIPIVVGVALVLVGLLVVIAGYVKRVAEAATALYLLNYQEVNASRVE